MSRASGAKPRWAVGGGIAPPPTVDGLVVSAYFL